MLKTVPRSGASVARAADPKAAAMSEAGKPPPVPGPDPASRAWLTGLRAEGAPREQAERRLHELLLKAARFEISRRRGSLPHLRGGDFDDLAHQAAGDAMLAILKKLDTYGGESRFSTWAYKFALLEAAVKLRRRAWQGREVPLEPEDWSRFAEGGNSPAAQAEDREVLGAVRMAIESELSPHQREVLVAVALNGVPIDVLAERLNTSRGALYKTIHDARKKLRAHLSDAGFRFADEPAATGGR
jgi:RNA polymerase sigma-70 factor (ECF subfamily)